MPGKCGGKKKYAWDDLFRRGTFTLVRGTDYVRSSRIMIQMIRNQASARGVGVKARIDGDSIHVEIVR